MPTPTCLKIIVKPGRSGTGQLNAPNQEIVTYLVQYDLPTSVAQDLFTATDGTTTIPAAYSALPGYPFIFLQKLEPRQHVEDGCFWDVVATYGSPIPQQAQKKPSATKYNVDIAGTLIPRQYPVNRDASNMTIQNTVGEPITGLTRTDYDEQITVSFHTRAPDWATIDACKGNVNDAPVTMTILGASRTFANNTLKLENVNWALVYDADQNKTVRMDYVLTYRHNNWSDVVANMGFLQNAGNGTVSSITIGDINAANGVDPGPHANDIKGTPTYLNEDGDIIPSGDPVYTLTFFNVFGVSFATLLDSELVT